MGGGGLVARLTGSTADIVQSELSDSGVQLEEQRERLANTTGSAEDSDLGQLCREFVISHCSPNWSHWPLATTRGGGNNWNSGFTYVSGQRKAALARLTAP